MMAEDFQMLHIRVTKEKYQQIKDVAGKNRIAIADLIRQYIDEGLTERIVDEHTDLIAHVVKKQLEVVLKPHVERLAALSSKGGHMAARATFLNVQALMDLVPPENRKDVRAMYDSASKKAVAYMQMPVEEYDKEEIYRKEI
jgi:hypothetical protein